jgi:hypothetical protein
MDEHLEFIEAKEWHNFPVQRKRRHYDCGNRRISQEKDENSAT